MKAKVIIENGKTEIVLTPENNFEKEVIEKVYDEKYQLVKTSINVEYSYYVYKNHNITLQITESSHDKQK